MLGMSMYTSLLDAFFTHISGASYCNRARWCQATANNNNSDGAIDFDEEQEPDVYEDDADQAGGQEDPDGQDANDDNIVVSGDANAAAAAKDKVKNTVESEKDKKVENSKRTTTPYMTKYERARVLGTRALQIR